MYVYIYIYISLPAITKYIEKIIKIKYFYIWEVQNSSGINFYIVLNIGTIEKSLTTEIKKKKKCQPLHGCHGSTRVKDAPLLFQLLYIYVKISHLTEF